MKICQKCNKVFTKPNNKFCSHFCYGESLKGKTSGVKGKKWKIKDTSNMGKMWTQERKIKYSELCKEKGFGKWMRGKKLSKETKEKMRLSHSGEKTNFWKGGKMKEYSKTMQIRHSIEFRLWREAIFARDNWTCQKCRIRGQKLHAHHIKNFAQYPELRLALDNGITLCMKCHTDFHKKYKKDNNSEYQLQEFLRMEDKIDLILQNKTVIQMPR